jgi:hypothetical protein
MKLQFSLATLLVCMTVLAVVAAVAAKMPVQASGLEISWYDGTYDRPPNAAELASRLAWSWPLAIAATLGVLWTIRRLKSRRHNEQPVG